MIALFAPLALAADLPDLAWFHPGDGDCLVTHVVAGANGPELHIPTPCPSAASLSVAADGRWLVVFRSKPTSRVWEGKPGEKPRELPAPPGDAAVLYDLEGKPVAVAVTGLVGPPSATGPMKATARRYALDGEAWKSAAEGEVSGFGNGRGWLMLDLVPSAARLAFTQTQPLVPTGPGWEVRLARPDEGVDDPKIGQPVVLAYEGVAKLATGGLDVGSAWVLNPPLSRRCEAQWCGLLPQASPFTWDARGPWFIGNSAGEMMLIEVDTGVGAFRGPGVAAFWPTPPPG